ncbi:hypothetical protein D6D13_09366 [Aureobasidium pullulans]|uniref:Uncharacterized protein n=1 Tax=Aureobasidium pullulans TaxID=5580 RepID=A0A4S9C592_AURPU|nr:hypothetical protein D6D13_09366 [Aureobasidium pullulans]
MTSFTISAPSIRILVALCICLSGLWTSNILNHPKTLKSDLSTVLSNRTLTLELPGHGENSIAAAYIPGSLSDGGRESIFWCSLLALASGGAYIYDRIRAHIWSQLSALNEGAQAVPKGERLRYHLNGVRNLKFTGWIHSTGDKDFFMACMLSVLAIIGALFATIESGLQNITSDTVVKKAEHFLSDSGAGENLTFGSSAAHGSYTLESWTCQLVPLIPISADDISARARDAVSQSCRDAHTSRYILLALLPLTILMLLTAIKPHWFTFTLGKDRAHPDWTAVPLEDNESEDEDDPMAGFGGNAREQWLLEEE